MSIETESRNGFFFIYPEGYSKEDFKSRISGTQLLERWKMNLAEIQSLNLSAFREESALDEIESQETGLPKKIVRCFFGNVIRINRFRPTKNADMQDCFYLLSEIEQVEDERKNTKNEQPPTAKAKCQEIATNIWENYPGLLIKNMIKHHQIQAVRKPNGDPYPDKTIHGWLAEVSPPNVSKHGRPTKKEQEHQAEICKKLDINPEI